MKIEIKSGFRHGCAVCSVSGTFPEFEVTTLAKAGPCTWCGDPATSIKVEIGKEADPRPIFEAWDFCGGPHTTHNRAEPLNAAARALCAQALPEGWGVFVPGSELVVTVGTFCYPLVQGMDIPEGGVVTYPGYDQRVTVGEYVKALVAGREPIAWWSPTQK